MSTQNPFANSTLVMNSLKIHVKEGSTPKEKVDVWVNAASISPLQVDNWGGVAGALRDQVKADATHYQELVNDWQNKNNQIAPGTADFVRDASGNPVQFSANQKNAYIIHAGAPMNSGDKVNPPPLSDTAKQTLEDAYLNILEKIQQFNSSHPNKPLKSVAIPPLGVGIYNVKAEESAICAAHAIEKFNQKYPSAQLEITVPLYNVNNPNNSINRHFGEALINALTKPQPTLKQSDSDSQALVSSPLSPISAAEPSPALSHRAQMINRNFLSAQMLETSENPAAILTPGYQQQTRLKAKPISQELTSKATQVANTEPSLEQVFQKIQGAIAKYSPTDKEQWSLLFSENRQQIFVNEPNNIKPIFSVHQKNDYTQFEFSTDPAMNLKTAMIAIESAESPITVTSENLQDMAILAEAAEKINQTRTQGNQPPIELKFSQETLDFLNSKDLNQHPHLQAAFEQAKTSEKDKNSSKNLK